MFDPLSPIYSESLRLQIYEFVQFLHATLKNDVNSLICNRCKSKYIGHRGSNMEIKVTQNRNVGRNFLSPAPVYLCVMKFRQGGNLHRLEFL